MNVNKVLTKDYEKRTLGERGKKQSQTNPNEPKTNPNEPNYKKTKMNVTSYITKEYENKSNWAICENEPKQTQCLPAISVAGQSQYNAALIWKMSVKGYV